MFIGGAGGGGCRNFVIMFSDYKKITAVFLIFSDLQCSNFKKNGYTVEFSFSGIIYLVKN